MQASSDMRMRVVLAIQQEQRRLVYLISSGGTQAQIALCKRRLGFLRQLLGCMKTPTV